MGNGNLTWCELHTLLSTTYYSGGTRRAPGSIICGWNWTRTFAQPCQWQKATLEPPKKGLKMNVNRLSVRLSAGNGRRVDRG